MSTSNDANLIDRLMTAAVIGLIGWNLWTTQQLSLQVARLEERMNIVELLRETK